MAQIGDPVREYEITPATLPLPAELPIQTEEPVEAPVEEPAPA